MERLGGHDAFVKPLLRKPDSEKPVTAGEWQPSLHTSALPSPTTGKCGPMTANQSAACWSLQAPRRKVLLNGVVADVSKS